MMNEKRSGNLTSMIGMVSAVYGSIILAYTEGVIIIHLPMGLDPSEEKKHIDLIAKKTGKKEFSKPE